jgi:hypothetical protein
LRLAASNYGQSPNNLVCGTWSTSAVVRCVETILDLETVRSAVARSPGPVTEFSLHITHVFMRLARMADAMSSDHWSQAITTLSNILTACAREYRTGLEILSI